MKILFLLPVYAVALLKPKLCIHCKHFISDNDTNEFGKCVLFPRIENKYNYLVTGVQDNDYEFCSISRKYDDMCGEEGNMFKKKHVSKYKGMYS